MSEIWAAIAGIIWVCMVVLAIICWWKKTCKDLHNTCCRDNERRDPGKVQSSNAQRHAAAQMQQRKLAASKSQGAPVQPQQQVVFYQIQTTAQGQTQIVYQQPPPGQQQVVYQQAPPGVGQGQIQIVYQKPPEGQQQVVYQQPTTQQQVVYQQPTTQPQVVYQTAPVPNRPNAPVTKAPVPPQPSAGQQPVDDPVADAPPSYGIAPPI